MMRGDLRAYWPLALVVLVSAVLAVLAVRPFIAMLWMQEAMGFFLVILAMLKLFDLNGFVAGFVKYDVVTQRVRAYGFAYPFIELGLGLGSVAGWCPVWLNGAILIVMGISGFGVLRAIRQGRMLNCACMGNILQVPLSTVSIVENFGMAAMAALMLLSLV